MSAMSNGVHDDAEDDLAFTNGQHGDEVLQSLQTLRKSHTFCDVKLVVDNHEIFAHKALLAAKSHVLFDLLAKGDDSSQTPSMLKLKDLNFKSFSYLLDYMYTGRLAVSREDVREVYATARRLKLAEAAQVCADFLLSTMHPGNCLGIRMCVEDDRFRSRVNEYIRENIDAVTTSQSFFSLPRIQLEVIGTDETQVTCGDSFVYNLALDYIKASVDEVKPKFDRLIEKVNVLYLSADGIFKDCKDVEDDSLKQDLAVQDYKKLIRRQSGINEARIPTDAASNGKTDKHHPFHKFNLNPDSPRHAREWAVIAGHRTKEHTYLIIMMLGHQMATLSLHFRIPQTSPCTSSSEGPDSPIHSKDRANSFEKLAAIIPLGTMSTPRCAFGIRAVKGKIVAAGGYDRGEVMKSAEMYDPDTNEWKMLPHMMRARCRFTAAHLENRLYAIGGSNGHVELADVECFDPETEKWSAVAKLTQPRASPGVAVLKGKIYCVGGSYGQESLKKCEVYDPETNTWSPIAPLNTGRFQACVRAFKNRLYAVGGTDGWNVFSTIEVYNPDTNTWDYGPSLNVARRGAGIEAFSGKLYIVGGSDGTQSLKTTESFDPKEQTWVFNPILSIPRANVGAAVIDNKLFAIGGFCGKRFLDTMEYYDVEEKEWCTFSPFLGTRPRAMSNASDTDSVNSVNSDTNINKSARDVSGMKAVNGVNMTKSELSAH